MKLNLLLAALLLTSCFSAVKAQKLLGISNGNFAGTNALYMNPAFIVDSRLGFNLNLGTLDIYASNNYLRYNSPNSIFKTLKNEEEFTADYLEEKLNGKPKLITTSLDLRGPSIMFTMSPRHSFAITTRVKGAVQMNNVSESSARLIKTGGDEDDLLNQINDDNKFSLNGNVNAELGFSYGRVLYDAGTRVLKSGITLKRVTGIYSSYFINEGSRFQVSDRTDANGTYQQIQVDNINARYGYLNEDLLEDIESSDVVNWLTKGDAPGKGWGLDLGLSYEYRPDIESYKYTVNSMQYLDHRKSKYKYRVGVALMDVGGVKYKSQYARSLDIAKQNVILDSRDFEEAEDTDEYSQIFNEAFGIRESDIKREFRSGLPTALNISFDYKLKGRLYVNTTLIQSLRKKEAVAMRQFSMLAVTPRLEMKALELAFPISLQNNYSVFAVGAMAKLGPFFIGSDNISGALNIGKPYGANVYAGVSLLSLHREKRKEEKIKKVKKVKNSTPVTPSTTPPAGNQ